MVLLGRDSLSNSQSTERWFVIILLVDFFQKSITGYVFYKTLEFKKFLDKIRGLSSYYQLVEDLSNQGSLVLVKGESQQHLELISWLGPMDLISLHRDSKVSWSFVNQLKWIFFFFFSKLYVF